MLAAPIELVATLERPVRVALQGGVTSLERALRKLPSLLDIHEHAEGLARAFNMTALLELKFGRAARARALCLRQLAWIDGLVAASGARTLLICALQPWVNLARLDLMEGATDRAQARLAALLAARRGQAVLLGSVRIKGADWPMLTSCRREIGCYLISVWACETLLAGLRNRRFDLIDRVGAVLEREEIPILHIAEAEARMIAEMLPGGPTAKDVDNIRLPAAVGEQPLHALALRRFQLKLRRGTPSALEQLVGIARHHLEAEDLLAWRLAVVQHAAAVLIERECGAAPEIIERGFDIAMRLGDEVLAAWFTDAGRALSHPAPVWVERRESLERSSWYAVVRGESFAPDLDGAARLDALTARLEALANAMTPRGL